MVTQKDNAGLLLLITRTHPRYRRDIANVIAWRYEFVYSFRYDLRCVAADVQDVGGEISPGMDALVVLEHRQKGENNKEREEQYPVRLAKIRHVMRAGNFVHVQFETSSFVSEKSTNLVRELINNERKKFPDCLLYKTRLVKDQLGKDDSVAAWYRIVRYLEALPPYQWKPEGIVETFPPFERMAFLHIANVSDLDRGQHVVFENGEFRVPSDTNYAVEFLHYFPRIAKATEREESSISYPMCEVVLFCPQDFISAVKPKALLTGTSGWERLVFSVKRSFRAHRTTVIMGESSNREPASLRLPEVEIRLLIKGRFGPDDLTLVFIGSGLLLFSVLELIANLSEKGLLQPLQWTLTILGLILTQWSWWIKRRLFG